MTPEQAISRIKAHMEIHKLKEPQAVYTTEALNMTICALKEIQLYKDGKLCLVPEDVYSKQCCELDAYKEIGTVEECRTAVEKQMPKEPVKNKYHHNCCPNCGWIVSGEGGYGEEFCPHCENCGQAIQWENLKGMEDENT